MSPAPEEAAGAVKVKVTVRPGPNTEATDFDTVGLASDSTLSFTAAAASDSFKADPERYGSYFRWIEIGLTEEEAIVAAADSAPRTGSFRTGENP